jgi:hypothetical protein
VVEVDWPRAREVSTWLKTEGPAQYRR